ncbi:heavy metal translocating P-type ATPase [Dasania sp. GY-MA-18]|uniref:Heavy metal translocating P-type ATPase n=1 Tax=Dasania phycosphaerae TaxID=2950436 RepID=A0A9J6RPJ5_9GAMM|nr:MULTISPECIES: heavy metal translocating P-type ATPase [Dasania]MCR8923662.1 heavy metal translocating P-type ATPase [Dasania sp. GY-MA-18]MCZ0866096.1 heavy metal translocating P-type ATPase [Dasania phycosphaerae]MCZ0869820.1 heavy metal translocating P-type ATPase [Dasania phycosphaerae]
MPNSSNTQRAACYHCQLPIMAGDRFECELDGSTRGFCCPACMAVAQTIHAGGLGAFYQYQLSQQQQGSEQRPQLSLLAEKFAAFDLPDFQQRFVKPQGQVVETELLIGGMHCAACVWLLEKQLSQLNGLVKVSVSLAAQKAIISWQGEQLKLSQICQSIAAIGYEPEPYHHDQLLELQQREQRTALRRLGIAGIGMMQVGMFAIALYAGEMQHISDDNRNYMRVISMLMATVVVFYSARSFFIGAWQGIKKAKPVMDLPVAIAIGLAYSASLRATFSGSGEVYFDSVTMFTFLLLAGRYVEMRARHYHGRLSSHLQSLLPSTATRIDTHNGEKSQQAVPLFNIQQGDILLVKPGHTIPADGIIVEGQSSINEAQLTGEFTPLNKGCGDSLIAGTINVSNPLSMRVTATGAKLQLESIAQLINQGQHSKPKVAILADRLSLYFISAVLLIAAATYFTWLSIDAQQAFWVSLSVLVVSCPCALSLATPTAITTAGHRLRQSGVFVAKAQLWESLPAIKHIVFDKTGTLTQGKLSIEQTLCCEGFAAEQVLRIAAQLENCSEHPIAAAFSSYSRSQASKVCSTPYQGLEGEVDGQRYRIGKASFAAAFYNGDQPSPPQQEQGQWILLSNSQGPCAWFQLSDPLRSDTANTVQQLKQQGFTLHLLSGDSSGSAQQLSQQLAMDHCIASASPADKLNYIRQLQQQGPVMMLGDGINDIPVLAAADVSVAMANAPDVAKTQADCILLSGQLKGILTLYSMATRTQRIIRQNLAWALLYNISIIPLAACGLIPPYLAALGMSLSSLIVLINALRLQRNNSGYTPGS